MEQTEEEPEVSTYELFATDEVEGSATREDIDPKLALLDKLKAKLYDTFGLDNNYLCYDEDRGSKTATALCPAASCALTHMMNKNVFCGIQTAQRRSKQNL